MKQQERVVVKFWVAGLPMPFRVEPRKYQGQQYPSLYTPPKQRAWKKLVAACAAKNRPAALLEGPLWLSILFVIPPPGRAVGRAGGSPYLKILVPTVTPDVTNYLKATEDGLSKIIFGDDAQVVRVTATKIYADPAVGQGPGARVTVGQMTSEDVLRVAGRMADE